MINCKKCEFEVSNNLKYAIMNNLCPACGNVLFGDSDIQRIGEVTRLLKKQEFSVTMDNILLNDISLFIFNNFLLENESVADKSPIDDASADVAIPDEASEEELIREQVRMEAQSVVGDDDEDLDDDLKIARLKRLAKESALRGNKGVSVKRVT